MRDDDEEVEASTKQAKVHVNIANVSTIIIQNWNRHGVCSPMLAPLQLGGGLHYRSNISSVLGALLQNRHAYSWTDDGKELRHPGFPGQVLRWQEPVPKCHMPKALKEKEKALKLVIKMVGKQNLAQHLKLHESTGDGLSSLVASFGGMGTGSRPNAAASPKKPNGPSMLNSPGSEYKRSRVESYYRASVPGI